MVGKWGAVRKEQPLSTCTTGCSPYCLILLAHPAPSPLLSQSPPPLIADVNLFELLKRNSFHGLSLSLVKLFLRQLLDSLSVLRDASIIHCDLKVRGRGDAT